MNLKERQRIIHGPSLMTEDDIYLFREGSHFRLYEKLGSHPMKIGKQSGFYFAVWAPNAAKVSVTGNFNNWDRNGHQLAPRWDGSGIWEGFISDLRKGDIYKYHILSKYDTYMADKGDPFAFFWEIAPKTASVTCSLDYEWHDDGWMKARHKHNNLSSPISTYEVHLGSWRRIPEENFRSLHYREMAEQLVAYVKKVGFTHVEFLPVMEHPFFGSWGYQTTGYFAPTSRYGRPQDFMYLIDTLHQNGIGVILDWVPSHFPTDEHGLSFFDGTYLFEHANPMQGYHPDWKSHIFNYGRPEVISFLISSAFFWLDKYHVDGLRVDAVASMLYLDYSRKEGEWIPNRYGGRENLEAIDFLKRLNKSVYLEFPDVMTIAEESTAWPMVTRPVHAGGLGFGMKWNMGWMHDTLRYFSQDPIFRKYHHNELTFSTMYAFTENFMLPLSHDEVVHGKGSLFGKMPGDEWQKYANLRLLFGYMFAHPGKKLLFMGGEFAQWPEWNHDQSLEWHSLEYPMQKGVQQWVRDLNNLYRREPSLHEIDFEQNGFEWVDFSDYEKSIVSFIRKGRTGGEMILVICNFTPATHYNYRIGVPHEGVWKEVLNSDAREYAGSGQGNFGRVESAPVAMHGRLHSLSLILPPLGVLFLKETEEGSS